MSGQAREARQAGRPALVLAAVAAGSFLAGFLLRGSRALAARGAARRSEQAGPRSSVPAARELAGPRPLGLSAADSRH